MVEIRNIINQNIWWKDKNFERFDKHLKELEGHLIKFKRKDISFKKGKIYLIRGPRQTGKTTYIKQTISKLIKENINPKTILYFACDFLASRRELRNVINYFLDMNISAENLYIFLDEITYLKDWSYEIKSLVDAGLFEDVVLVLTGSGSAARMKRNAELLPGRGLEGNEYLLKPLTFREFALQSIDEIKKIVREKLSNYLENLKKELYNTSITLEDDFKDIIKNINQIVVFQSELDFLFNMYILTGSFPKPINEYIGNNFNNINEETYTTMVKIVLGDFYKYGKQETIARQIFEEILRKYGSRYSFIALSKNMDITHPTLIEYIELLKESFITHILYSIDFKKGTPSYKANKKIYLTDPFMFHSINSLLKGSNAYDLSKEMFLDERMLSSIVESIVGSHLSQLKEKPYLKEPETFLYYFYNPIREFDFIYKKDNSDYLGIEVKYQKKVKMSDIAKITQIDKFIVLTKSTLEIKENMILVPISVFLSLLEKSEKCL
ncbi:MAG: ATP-binding protein [Methanosarcinales archaeon]